MLMRLLQSNPTQATHPHLTDITQSNQPNHPNINKQPMLMRLLPGARQRMVSLPQERAALQRDIRLFIHQVFRLFDYLLRGGWW